jgi:UDP-N-acetylglucosamine pyrophosphorylase
MFFEGSPSQLTALKERRTPTLSPLKERMQSEMKKPTEKCGRIAEKKNIRELRGDDHEHEGACAGRLAV